MKAIAHIQAFFKDEEGASGIEYAMIAGMVAVVLSVKATDIKDAIGSIFGTVSTKLTALK